MSSYLVPRLIVFNYGIINNASHLPLLQLRVLIKAHTHPRIWEIYYLKCLSVILGKIATMWQITQWFNISLCVSNSFFGKHCLPPCQCKRNLGVLPRKLSGPAICLKTADISTHLTAIQSSEKKSSGLWGFFLTAENETGYIMAAGFNLLVTRTLSLHTTEN